jgi:hypothetical protein
MKIVLTLDTNDPKKNLTKAQFEDTVSYFWADGLFDALQEIHECVVKSVDVNIQDPNKVLK